MTTKIVCLVTFLLLAGLSSRSQSIIGSWKKTATVLENSDGSSRDLQKLMTKSRPCLADVQYIFQADGKQLTHLPKGCDLPGLEQTADWKVSGNTIGVTGRKGNGLPVVTATYTMTFSGNTVLFTHVYSAQEKAALHSKAAKLIITYQRI